MRLIRSEHGKAVHQRLVEPYAKSTLPEHRAQPDRRGDHTAAEGGGWSRSSSRAIVVSGASWRADRSCRAAAIRSADELSVTAL